MSEDTEPTEVVYPHHVCIYGGNHYKPLGQRGGTCDAHPILGSQRVGLDARPDSMYNHSGASIPQSHEGYKRL